MTLGEKGILRGAKVKGNGRLKAGSLVFVLISFGSCIGTHAREGTVLGK